MRLSDFEAEFCGVHELTFVRAEERCRRIGARLNMEIMRCPEGWNNLGLLLSDQCPHALRVVVYAGKDQTAPVKSQKEFSGSVAAQLEDAITYLSSCHKSAHSAVSFRALEEAVTNAVLHRDYSFGGASVVSLFKDHAEVASLGGLSRLTREDVSLGISLPRNPGLAECLRGMGFCRLSGSGIPCMKAAYDKKSLKPEIKTADHVFLVTLPAMTSSKKSMLHFKKSRSSSAKQEAAILDYLADNHSVRREQVQRLLGVGQTRALNILKSMVKRGKIIAAGHGKRIEYQIA